MAEIATLARPYAEALFKASGAQAVGLLKEVSALAAVAADERLLQFADNPKSSTDQVCTLVAEVVGVPLSTAAQNFLRTVLENGRLSVLPQMAEQFRALVNAQGGVSDVLIESAFEIDAAQLSDVMATLERRFARKLNPRVEVRPELIGGIRAVVGDEVLDASVASRLQQMKVALTA
jgi:F-type H+-transporting ATPase subunit delta